MQSNCACPLQCVSNHILMTVFPSIGTVIISRTAKSRQTMVLIKLQTRTHLVLVKGTNNFLQKIVLLEKFYYFDLTIPCTVFNVVDFALFLTFAPGRLSVSRHPTQHDRNKLF